MSFSSMIFLIFIITVCLVYFLTPDRFKWVILLIASYVFYLYAGVTLAAFLLFTTITTYAAGRIMGNMDERAADRIKALNKMQSSAQQSSLQPPETQQSSAQQSDSDRGSMPKSMKKALKQQAKKNKRVILILTLILNFGILIILKYNDMFPEIRKMLKSMNILLPLGISFYTFQSMGYLIDVFRSKYAPERNICKFALFVSFFPQLVQGPISRFDDLAKQLYAPHRFDYTRAAHGAELILWGYFKKMVIADRIGIFVSFIFANYAEYNGLYILTAGVLYCIQIYTDFSGGMDIALGVAEVLGIYLPQNFERPYFAKTLSEYWRRWHITLNRWLRDYIFYPLSLSKIFVKMGQAGRRSRNRGKSGESKVNENTGFARFMRNFAIYFATLIVRIINAIWHGGSPKYFVNGIYHGLLIIFSLQLQPFFKWLKRVLKINTECFSYRLFQIIRTFTLVLAGRIMLHANDFEQGIDMFRQMFAKFNPWIFIDGSLYNGTGLTEHSFRIMIISILILIFFSILQERGIKIREALDRQNMVFRWMVILCCIFGIIIFGVYGSGYDSTMFIYQQF